MDRRKYIFLCAIATVLTICFLLLGFRIFTLIERSSKKTEPVTDDAYAYQSGGRPEYLVDGKWYLQKNHVETFLLIGIDKYEAAIRNDNGYRNREQSDALFVLAVDRDHQTFTILHVNRDTMANIRMLDLNGNPYSTFEGQLALSHTYGSGREDSCENTLWSVSDYLYGLQIDHYLSITMDAVGILNDKIGGVTVTIPDDMTAADETFVKGATVRLTGDQALKFVRARGELADSSNLSRMARQRQYVTAFLEQAKSAIATNPSLPTDISLSITDYLVSDLLTQEFSAFADVLTSYRFDGILPIEGEARKGEQFMEFYADETALKQLILDTFYEEK